MPKHSPYQPHQPQPIYVQQAPSGPNALAGLCSFIFPGLGQLVTGRPITGLLLMVLVPLGYIAFILPGLILHLVCVYDAAKNA